MNNFKYYKWSALLFFLSISVFFIYIEWFPLKNSLFNFVFVACISLFLFLLTKRKYTSLFLAASFTIFIILISIFKQKQIGVYLYFSDLIFFLKDPFFILDFVSIPLLCFLFFTWLAYVSLLYMSEPKTKMTTMRGVIVAGLCGLSVFILSDKMKNFEAHKFHNAHTKTLQNFFASMAPRNALNLPKLEQNNATCCNVVKKEDIAILPVPAQKPNIVFVLLESTFNLNRIPSLELPNQWANFKSSPMETMVAGGGTWTLEYAILHGVNPKIYGGNLMQVNIWGPGILPGRIVPSLKEIGYQAYSVMPYVKTFFNSENYHKSLGINNIIDCHKTHSCAFYSQNTPEKKEPQDRIMYNEVYELLEKAKEPSFVFALTMLQHSPHDLSSKNDSIQCTHFSSRACNVLQEYKNREKIVQNHIKEFVEKINSLERETIVVFFGDHIPADVNSSLESENFLNNDKFTTLTFAYSTRTKSFINLQNLVGTCHSDFKLHAEDLDILPLYMAGMRSNYINEKFEKLQKFCTLSKK